MYKIAKKLAKMIQPILFFTTFAMKKKPFLK